MPLRLHHPALAKCPVTLWGARANTSACYALGERVRSYGGNWVTV